MARVTYIDHEKACPETSFHGIAFERNIPVEVDDEIYADTLDTLEGNPWFKIEDRAKRKADPEMENPSKARERGAQAFRDQKPFSIPPRWRKLPAGDEWAAGYKAAKADMDASRDAQINA